MDPTNFVLDAMVQFLPSVADIALHLRCCGMFAKDVVLKDLFRFEYASAYLAHVFKRKFMNATNVTRQQQTRSKTGKSKCSTECIRKRTGRIGPAYFLPHFWHGKFSPVFDSCLLFICSRNSDCRAKLLEHKLHLWARESSGT